MNGNDRNLQDQIDKLNERLGNLEKHIDVDEAFVTGISTEFIDKVCEGIAQELRMGGIRSSELIDQIGNGIVNELKRHGIR